MIFDILLFIIFVFVSIWISDNGIIDYNGYVRGNCYYMFNYECGLMVLDILDFIVFVEVGFFDIYFVFNSINFNGVWGVYLFLFSGNILVSDI